MKTILTALRAAGVHVLDWLEGYFWVPVSLLSIAGSALLYYYFTGRPPHDPPDFMPELSGRFVLAILATLATSITIHATVGWPKENEHCSVAITRILASVLIVSLWAFVFLH